MRELQKLVAKSVADRGYREGWTDEQFAARQVCKAVEELFELAQAIQFKSFRMDWLIHLDEAEFEARSVFDDKAEWHRVIAGVDSSVAATELADVVIPLLTMAETLGIDLEQAIREKVTGDVARGVR